MNCRCFRPQPAVFVIAVFSCYVVSSLSVAGAEPPGGSIAIVGHVKVLSQHVPDVSSIEAWGKSFIRDDMSPRDKALAIFKTKVMFSHQDPPPLEYLQEAACVHDPIKSFNVYGYGMCCCASSNVEALARQVGLPARGWTINAHSVSEVQWNDAWHLLDASLINYFPKQDGELASVEEIEAAIRDWYDKNPGFKGDPSKLEQFQRENGWSGWRRGPALIAQSPFYDAGGFWPAKTHGWSSTMLEYDGRGGTPFVFEYGYSQGYEVNIQLRPGERLTRNWFHNGLHVNGVGKDGAAPGCLKQKVGEGFLEYSREQGDLTDSRIGSGTLQYEPTLTDETLRLAALRVENLMASGQSLGVQDGGSDGVLELRMPSSYVYLTGSLDLGVQVGKGAAIVVQFSDNNGLDWQDVTTITDSGDSSIDLQPFAFRRYDYRLRLIVRGADARIDRLKITHDIQCSQRALPTLDKGENNLTFSAGPDEGTVTIQGSTTGNGAGKQIQPFDFHPQYDGVEPKFLRDQRYGKPGSVTFPISAPGDITRLRFGMHYRCRDAGDQWEMQVSFDEGETFRTVDTVTGPTQGACRYVTVSDVPAGSRAAQIRFVGSQRNTTAILSLRIDADYKLPSGGFRPVQVTYRWREADIDREHVHIARSPNEIYHIACDAKPAMKSITLELAE